MMGNEALQHPQGVTNRNLFLPYFLPYFAYVLIASFFEHRIPIELNYAIRIVSVTALLIWAWQWYVPLKGPKNPFGSAAWGVAAGLIGCACWILLLVPFVDPTNGPPWSDTGFYLRLAAATIIVPLFEEIFMRGYVFRVALQWDTARKNHAQHPLNQTLDDTSIFAVEPGQWSSWAVVISTVAFTLGHQSAEWPAAVVYGLLMVGLWIVRKDLLSCVVAHGVTNFTLALYVKLTGQWGLW